MVTRCLRLVTGLVLASLVVFSPGAASAQTSGLSSAPAAAPPDLSGIWDQQRGGPLAGHQKTGYSITSEEPPMTPWAAAQWKAIREGPKRNKFDRGNENLDPSYTHCLPFGPVRSYTNEHPFEIVQSRNVVYILFESDHEIRRVYLDGRTHAGMYSTWLGHSIGKWDGDTLVIDTAMINDLTWLDTMGHVHSDALHIVERMRRISHDVLQVDFTFDDPKAYTKPWSGKRMFQLAKGPKAEILEDILCEDHLTEEHVPRLLRGDKAQ